MNDSRHTPSITLRAGLLAFALLSGITVSRAQPTDPRAPGAIALPEIGRLEGSLKCVTHVDERYGRQIYPIGDVDGDSLNDWILTHRRCDTSINGHASMELLLYHGVRGGLPPASSGIRIGPSEVGADCSFIGAGDYDGDGHRDLAISQRILDDPFTRRVSVSSIVVFWNDGAGRFSIEDTTHLTAANQRVGIMSQADDERWARVPEYCDLDRDGLADLVVVTYAVQLIDTVNVPFPRVLVYRGHRNGRWGRNGIARAPSWQLWQRHFTRRVSVVDHDGDGVLDIAMFLDNDDGLSPAGVTVAYGRPGLLPDTVSERIGFSPFEGRAGVFGLLADLTGDHVPELVVTAADTIDNLLTGARRWLIFVGRRGQRLLEQYGSGHDPPRPGDLLWWGRPWTIILPPSELDAGWSRPSRVLFDAGDVGLDGVGDVCAVSFPRVVCYNGGGRLDSRIDATIEVWPADGPRARLSVLGDIDGGGRPAIGASFDGGGVRFYAASRSVPRGGTPIRLPEGSDRPVGIQPPGPEPLPLSITPNPARASTLLTWPARGAATVALLDLQGRELRRWLLPPGSDELTLDLAGLPSGAYLLSVISGDRSVRATLVHLE